MTAVAIATARRRVPLPAVVTVVSAAALFLLLMSGRAAELRVAYPAAAMGIASWLYLRYSFAGYVEFVWWIWFLSPGVRRLVDLQTGWDPTNPISITPLLVSSLAAFTVLRRLPELRRRGLRPWALLGACVGYGFLLGVLLAGAQAAVYALFSWGVPLVLGIAIAMEWRRYPRCAAAVRRAFLLGSVALAGYAVWQFLAPPPWDRYWLQHSGLASLGHAFPFEIRVFSLVNGPLALATVLLAGIVLLLGRRGALRAPALALLLLVLLLTLVRSVWLAGAVAVVIYAFALPARGVRRLGVTVAVTVAILAVLPVLISRDVSGPTTDLLRTRIHTLADVRHDISFNARVSFLDQARLDVLERPFGHGLGSTGVATGLASGGDGIRDFDNGILAVLYSLGWIAGTLFLAAAGWIVGRGLARRESAGDTVAKSARAIAVACLLLSLGGNIFTGITGAVLWTFAGLLLASHRWHDARLA